MPGYYSSGPSQTLMQRPSYRLTPAPQHPLLGKASRALYLSITLVLDGRQLDAKFFAGLGVCRIPLQCVYIVLCTWRTSRVCVMRVVEYPKTEKAFGCDNF